MNYKSLSLSEPRLAVYLKEAVLRARPSTEETVSACAIDPFSH